MREYAKARRARGAEPGTVKRDLGVLSRMFTLALQAARLARRPYIPRLPENPPRQGFLEHAEYLAIREHLPAHFRDVLDFGYLSGWRRAEILTLEWRDVDRPAGVIRLRPEVCKTREGRVLVLSASLRDGIERRWHHRALGCPFVFHEAARHLDGFKHAWDRACKAASLSGKLFHDLRRTAIRNMVRDLLGGSRDRCAAALCIRGDGRRTPGGPAAFVRGCRGASSGFHREQAVSRLPAASAAW